MYAELVGDLAPALVGVGVLPSFLVGVEARVGVGGLICTLDPVSGVLFRREASKPGIQSMVVTKVVVFIVRYLGMKKIVAIFFWLAIFFVGSADVRFLSTTRALNTRIHVTSLIE
jgi:hypothetical protein